MSKESEVIDPAGRCVHDRVQRVVDNCGHYTGTWRCTMCHEEFFHLDLLHTAKLQVMEPHATLRDQFAMAAMVADSIQSALIAVSYIAQGKSFSGDFADLGTDAEEYYKTADAMLEARKK